MALTVTHADSVTVVPPDPNNPGKVQPSWWPKPHTVTGNLPVSQLNSGTDASSGTFLRGDGVWAAPGIRAQYIGQVATRSWLPQLFDGTLKEAMTRSKHFARSNITQLALVIANWYSDSSGEHTTGGTLSVTASIEYPFGTIAKQITFSGSATGTAASGSNIVSDYAAVNIPFGDAFYVRIHHACSAGLARYSLTGAFRVGDVATYSTTTTADETLNAAWAPSAATSSGYMPVAIIGPTSRAAVAIFGDSIAGQTDTTDVWCDRGAYARSIGKALPYLVVSNSGQQLTTFLTSNARSIALANTYCTHVLSIWGRNDMQAGRTAAQMLTDTIAFVALFPTLQVYVSTNLPDTTGSWTTISGQTGVAWEAARLTYNSTIRNNQVTGAAGIIDLGRAVESPIDGAGAAQIDSGFWSFMAAGTPLGYTADGVHPNTAGCIRIANSNCINPAWFV